MDKYSFSCRGCLKDVKQGSYYSFIWEDVKDLFVECTSIEIPAYERSNLPEQICAECYVSCKRWKAFKQLCLETDEELRKHLASKPASIEVNDKEDVSQPMDEDQVSSASFEFVEEVFYQPVVSLERLNTTVISQLTKQKERREPEPNWKCLVCHSMVPPSVHLRDHLKRHYSEEDPKCPICQEKFNRGSKVYPHFLLTHRYGRDSKQPAKDDENKLPKRAVPKECPLCHEEFAPLWKHIFDSHLQRGQVKCPICKSSFGALKRHILVHTGERPFICKFCGTGFQQICTRNFHIKKFHKDTTSSLPFARGPMKCPVCQRLFKDRSTLHVHFVAHTNERPYYCTYCSKEESKYKHVIRNHIKSVHPKRCSKTGAAIKEGSIFRNSLPWEQVDIPQILKRIQEGEKTTTTTEDEATTSEDEGEEVSDEVQKESKDLKCHKCDKMFNRIDDLETHMVVHTDDESPFVCKYCSKEYRQKTHAIHHIKRLHAGESSLHGVKMKTGTKTKRLCEWRAAEQ